MAGAPKGNLNAVKAKLWEGALRRGLAKDRQRLHRIAEQVLVLAEEGVPWAVTEVRNTLDGKPKESVEVTQHHIVHDERILEQREELKKASEALLIQ